MMPGSSWSRGGLAGIVAFISLIILGVILHFGPRYGVDTHLKQALVFAAIWVVLLIGRYIPFMFRFMREKYHRWQEQKNNALPSDESRVARTPPRNVTVDTIREAMRTLYGRRWGRKVRILLITGIAAEVEQLTPGLTTHIDESLFDALTSACLLPAAGHRRTQCRQSAQPANSAGAEPATAHPYGGEAETEIADVRLE
jgi:type VI secretion system protein ImpL